MNVTEHLFVRAIDKCSKVQAALTTMLQFGWNHHDDGKDTTAIAVCRQAITDLVAVMEVIEENGYQLVQNHSRTAGREEMDLCKRQIRDDARYSQSMGLIRQDPNNPLPDWLNHEESELDHN